MPRITEPTVAEHRAKQRAAVLQAAEDLAVERGGAAVMSVTSLNVTTAQTMAKTTAATTVLIANTRIMRVRAGALSGVPGTTSPFSSWVFNPNGRTANSTSHQMMK